MHLSVHFVEYLPCMPDIISLVTASTVRQYLHFGHIYIPDTAIIGARKIWCIFPDTHRLSLLTTTHAPTNMKNCRIYKTTRYGIIEYIYIYNIYMHTDKINLTVT